ncbi:MAG TPA: HAD domain-containing protein [Micromonospora sp.]
MAAGPADRPLIFLDVDGPLITFAARPTSQDGPAGLAAADLPDTFMNPLLDRLRPQDGRMLAGLGCQLVWATTWMADANEVVSPLIGLPDLPVVDWPDSDDEPRHGLHWKTTSLIRWAAGRPFVWLDDEITDADRSWVAAHHPARALLHRVDPYVGFTGADFSAIRRWLAE